MGSSSSNNGGNSSQKISQIKLLMSSNEDVQPVVNRLRNIDNNQSKNQQLFTNDSITADGNKNNDSTPQKKESNKKIQNPNYYKENIDDRKTYSNTPSQENNKIPKPINVEEENSDNPYNPSGRNIEEIQESGFFLLVDNERQKKELETIINIGSAPNPLGECTGIYKKPGQNVEEANKNKNEPSSIFFSSFQNVDERDKDKDKEGNKKKYWTNTGDEGVSPLPNNESNNENNKQLEEKRDWTNTGNEISQNPNKISQKKETKEEKKEKIKNMIRKGYVPLFIQVVPFPMKCFVVTKNIKVQNIIKSYEEQTKSDLKNYKFFIKNKIIEDIEETIEEAEIGPLNIISGFKR